MAILKFFGWIFNAKRRYFGEIRRYEKGGLGRRIFAIILSLVFLGVVAGLEYWFNMHFTGKLVSEMNWLVTILIGVLTVAVIFATIERCIVFTWVGFSNFAFNSITNKIEEKEKAKKEAVGEETLMDGETEQSSVQTQDDIKKRNKVRRWDFAVAISQLVIIVGVVLVTVFMLKDLWLWIIR